MKRVLTILFLAVFFYPVSIFAQQAAPGIRDYVGLINQSYHPGIVSYFEKAKKEYEKQRETDIVKAIDIFLGGGFGSGFLYNDARGNFYVITNNHVIAQAHTVSITFERVDGTKTRLDNLKIIATDEEDDLALLLIPASERPLVTRGLTFLTRDVNEGEDVFTAGFPGLGITPIWQFGRGMVSNASARFPRSINDNTMMGPFIQHTAQVDAGNSGGPLLVTQQNAPSGYAVAGINTLKAIGRQAANYSVPISKVQAFINNALNPRPETFREALDERLTKFIEGMSGNTAVYEHIAEFLSAECIGENAEFAFEEMLENANRTVVRSFIDKSREDLVSAMGIAIAWTIENSVRGGGALRTSLKEVTGSGEEYTVVFVINNKDVSSTWIREYGNWRIKTFGTAATGDLGRLDTRQAKRDALAGIKPDAYLRLDAGYGFLFDKSSTSIYASLDFEGVGFSIYYVNSDFFSFGGFVGFGIPIASGSGFMPYFRLGLCYNKDVHYDNWINNPSTPGDDFEDFFKISVFFQGGLRIFIPNNPGLYGNIGYQYNLLGYNKQYRYPFSMGLTFTLGYSFD